MPQLTPQELDQIRNSMASAEDSVVIAMIKAVLSGGIDKVHPDVLQICVDEINARGISADMMNENRKRNTMKLSETKARRAIRKWLFEYSTDSGVSHRMSTDDKIAGKLGDNREDQPTSTIPQEIPIVATAQMSTQLTQAMPPVEDPNFVPGTLDELGKAVDILSQTIPSTEIEWYYEKMQELADEAIVKGNKVDMTDGLLDGEMQLDAVVNPSSMSSEEAVAAQNENWNRWSTMISKSLGEAKKSKSDPLNLRRRKLTQRDMMPTWQDDEEWLAQADTDGDGEVSEEEAIAAMNANTMSGEVDADGVYQPSQADLEDMLGEFPDLDITNLPGFNPNKHKTREERQAELAAGEFDGDAKLRELVDLGIYPSVRTMSGMRKKIKAEIDPLVQMYATARPAFDWLTGWYQDERQLSWNGQQIAGPDVYLMAIQAWEKQHKKNPAKLQELASAIETGGFYTECMAEIVMAPIVRKWTQGVKDESIDVSSRKAKNNFQMSDWILETVLNSGFGKSGPRRKAGKVQKALDGMAEFKAAMAAVTGETATPTEET